MHETLPLGLTDLRQMIRAYSEYIDALKCLRFLIRSTNLKKSPGGVRRAEVALLYLADQKNLNDAVTPIRRTDGSSCTPL